MRKPMSEELDRLKKLWGWSDEQIKDLLTEKHWRLLDRGHKFDEYRLVAEVVEARNCLARHKVGERYVFHGSGFLLPEESSVRRFCLWAMAPLLPFSYMFYDRISLDADPTSFAIDSVGCADVGIECGGYGKVIFKVYGEKAPTTKRK